MTTYNVTGFWLNWQAGLYFRMGNKFKVFLRPSQILQVLKL
jgi:hypothetical protein